MPTMITTRTGRAFQNSFDDGLRAAAILVTRKARQHEEAQAEIEAEDPHCEEAMMHHAEARGLREAAADILALILDQPEITF